MFVKALAISSATAEDAAGSATEAFWVADQQFCVLTDQSYEHDAGMKDSHDPEVDRHGQHGASSVGWQDGDGGIEDSWHSGADPWTTGGEGTAATPTTVTTPRGGQ